MGEKKWALIIAMLVALTASADCRMETMKSLEQGVSFEYPEDLRPDLSSSIIGLSGPQGVKIVVGSFKKDKGTTSLEDVISAMESTFDKDLYDFEVLSTTEEQIAGNNAVIKYYAGENSEDSLKIKSIYLQSGNMFYYIGCVAPDTYYDMAESMYFTAFINSLEFFAVDDTLEENIDGFPKITSKAIWSSPALADINGDGKLEIIIGTNEKLLQVWASDGSELPGFPVETDDVIRSSPAVADLDGDGQLDIIAGCDDENLYAWNGQGSLLPGFPRKTEGGVRSSPALGDINGDGKLEVVVGSLDTGIYAWMADGSLICGYPVITGVSSVDGVWSSPAIGDIAGDDKPDVIIAATRIDQDMSDLFDTTVDYAVLYALDEAGMALPGFPANLAFANQVVYGSPALGDLNGDGGLEIVIGASDGIYAFDRDGEELDGFPRETDGGLSNSQIALCDLDGDGGLEMAAGATDGRLYVLKGDGSDYPGFPIQTGGYIRHVTVGDIDGDGAQEILGGSTDNRVRCFELDGTEAAGFPKVTLNNIETAPTLGDLEGDGSLELVVGSDDGALYAWRISESFGVLQWPMVRQNVMHTGVYQTS